MRVQDDPGTAAARGRRTRTLTFYRRIVNGAFELGEVARIEIEIQKLYASASPEPRCPRWHEISKDSPPLSKSH
jgi:hypothetical protein